MKMIGKTYVAIVAFVMYAMMAGCGSGKLSNDLVVSLASGSVTAGAQAQLRATRGNSDGTVIDVTNSVNWVSSQTSVATISPKGVLSSLAAGTTSITATVDTASGSLTLAVGAPALTALAVSPQNTSVPSGYTQQFNATATFANGATADDSSSVTWSVAPASIASIDHNGLLLTKSTGTFTVTATSGTVKATATGTCTNALLTSLAVTPTGASVSEGATKQFTATATFSDLTAHDVSATALWSSSNTALLQINKTGLATAQTGVAAGSATVFAQVGTLIASTPVNVVPAVVAGPALTALVVNPTSSSVAQHTGTQLRATGYYADGSQQDISDAVTWTTNNSAVSNVNSTGLVTTGTPGASTIQASVTPSTSSRRLHGYAATALQSQSVSLVTAATLVEVIAQSPVTTIPIGAAQQLQLFGIFSDGTKQDLSALATWQSTNTAVASVSASGVATGVSAGGVTFIASFGGQSDTTPTLQVTNSTLNYLTVQSIQALLIAGAGLPVSVIGHYSDASTQDLSLQASFTSSNPAVASITSSGFVLGVTPGHSVITASVQGQSATLEFAVISTTLTAVTVVPVTPRSRSEPRSRFERSVPSPKAEPLM